MTAQPSTARGHMPLVDRFLAPLAAASSSPVKRPKPKGKLLDVARMFHEVAPPPAQLCFQKSSPP